MALPVTMRRFDITLADSDRGVYESIDLRIAQHPSESERYLVARIVARALEHAEGLEFAKGGVSDDTEPALVQRDLRGDLLAWIEIGAPTTERLHKATKAAPRVVVYTWKAPDQLAAAIVENRVHKGSGIELHGLAPEWLDRVASTLDRINKWELSVAGGALYLTIGGSLFEGVDRRISIG